MPATICNPIDLPYRYQQIAVGPFSRKVFREAADPSIAIFQGRFYLFPSMSRGFWHSSDLATWDFVETPIVPTYDYAPDVCEIDGQLVVCASRNIKKCSFYRTRDPLGGQWEEIPGTFNFFDPNLFQDDDGRLYLYSGCGNKNPITGVELDRATFARIGEPVPIIEADADQHGWERTGDNHSAAGPSGLSERFISVLTGWDPFIEGAWMTKHRGRYYLQYAAPGTQLNTYADGYYTADTPLGPFTYSPHSPFSSKPGGFATGAGHGSTFSDQHGNWWHIATMRISVNQMFERRIGLFPAGFDADGVLFCNTEFGDYPMSLPNGPADPWSLSARSMLLSYRCPVTASSSDPANPPQLAVDENIRTWWRPADAETGHWLRVELPAGSQVHAIQVNLADEDLDPPRPPRSETGMGPLGQRYVDHTHQPAEYAIEGSQDGTNWTAIEDTRGSGRDRPHGFVVLDAPRPYSYVRVTGFGQPYSGRFAVSGLRVFGRGSGEPPAEVIPTAHRTGPLNARIDWAPVPGAQGYNVRYGLAADKLYASWLVYDHDALDLSALNADQAYWVAVDSFNENGITRGRPVTATAELSTLTQEHP